MTMQIQRSGGITVLSTVSYRTVVGEGNKTGECLLRSHVVPDAGKDPLLTSSGSQI
jgi:hypothetical protein